MVVVWWTKTSFRNFLRVLWANDSSSDHQFRFGSLRDNTGFRGWRDDRLNKLGRVLLIKLDKSSRSLATISEWFRKNREECSEVSINRRVHFLSSSAVQIQTDSSVKNNETKNLTQRDHQFWRWDSLRGAKNFHLNYFLSETRVNEIKSGGVENILAKA